MHAFFGPASCVRWLVQTIDSFHRVARESADGRRMHCLFFFTFEIMSLRGVQQHVWVTIHATAPFARRTGSRRASCRRR